MLTTIDDVIASRTASVVRGPLGPCSAAAALVPIQRHMRLEVLPAASLRGTRVYEAPELVPIQGHMRHMLSKRQQEGCAYLRTYETHTLKEAVGRRAQFVRGTYGAPAPPSVSVSLDLTTHAPHAALARLE